MPESDEMVKAMLEAVNDKSLILPLLYPAKTRAITVLDLEQAVEKALTHALKKAGKAGTNGHAESLTLTLRQTAEALGISLKAARSLARSGQLEVVRREKTVEDRRGKLKAVGVSKTAPWLVTRESLRRWLDREKERL